jgi:predicted 3-demethylubiquinone-9 3-methyltransferase (glyoxalase superfamily)
MPKITPFLWFDNNAEEAMDFYVAVFKNSKILRLQRFENAGPGGKGTVVTGTFELDGQQFMALQGGPLFKFTEAISMSVNCETQEEVDYFWEKLTAGGNESQCG